MCGEIGYRCGPRIHETEGDHRRSTGRRRCKKEGELIHEMADRGAATGIAVVNPGRKKVFREPQILGKETHLVLLGFKIDEVPVGQDKVQEHESRADEIKRMSAAVAEVVLFDLTIDSSREEMKYETSSQIVPRGSMTSLG